jgi:hypothetical protein
VSLGTRHRDDGKLAAVADESPTDRFAHQRFNLIGKDEWTIVALIQPVRYYRLRTNPPAIRQYTLESKMMIATPASTKA